MAPELQPFTGTETEEELLSKLLNKLAEKNDYKGITISGGEPFEQPQALLKLLKLLRNNFEDVFFTGFEKKMVNIEYTKWFAWRVCKIMFELY